MRSLGCGVLKNKKRPRNGAFNLRKNQQFADFSQIFSRND